MNCLHSTVLLAGPLAALLLATPAAAQTAITPVSAPTSTMAAPMATVWQMDPGASVIMFSGEQMGSAFTGRFARFNAEIVFDENDLAQSYVKVSIDPASATTGDTERDDTMKDTLWFDVTKFPAATFESTALRKTGNGHFDAQGNLTIRDVSQSFTFPFLLDIKTDADSGKKTATMQATFKLNRSTFGLGQGDWQDTSYVADNVDVTITVVAYNQSAAPAPADNTEIPPLAEPTP